MSSDHDEEDVDMSSFSSIVWHTLKNINTKDLKSLTTDPCSRQSLMACVGVSGLVFAGKTMINLGRRRTALLRADQLALALKQRAPPGQAPRLPSGVQASAPRTKGAKAKATPVTRNRSVPAGDAPAAPPVPALGTYIMNAANWAVAAFAFTGVAFMEVCRSQKAAEARQIAQIMEAQKRRAPKPPQPAPTTESEEKKKGFFSRWV